MAFTIEKTSRALRQKPMVRMSFLVNNQLLMRSMGENMGQKHWRPSFFLNNHRMEEPLLHLLFHFRNFCFLISYCQSPFQQFRHITIGLCSQFIDYKVIFANKFLCNKIIIVNIFMASSCILHHTATTKTLKRITMDDQHSA